MARQTSRPPRGWRAKFGPDLYAGFEYYADFGKIGAFPSFEEQQHTLFAVTDFKLGVFDVNFGVGYGLTPASDRWVGQDHHRLCVSGARRQDGGHRLCPAGGRQSDGACFHSPAAALTVIL
jgi:hypothetical protein